MSSLVDEIPVVHNTLGALFAGVVVAMGLWGVGCVQMYHYFDKYTKDDWTLKTLVVVVWALDTAHQGMIIHSIYIYLVSEYGKPESLNNIVPTLLYEVIVSAIICFLVQCFLVMRVWKLSRKNIWIAGTLMSLVISELIVSIIYTAKALPLGTFAKLTQVANLSRAINALAAAGDVAIAACLIILLSRSRTGFKHIENVINKLILFAINTGALTSFFAVMSLITITVLPNTFVYIVFYVNMSRLYTNTLFATLNARRSLRGGHPDDTENASAQVLQSMNRRPRMDVESGKGNRFPNHHTISIKVDTEMACDDGEYQPKPTKSHRAGSDTSEVSIQPSYYGQKAELPQGVA